MKKLIKTFALTGVCEIHVDKVIKAWNDKFSISRWDDKYTLIQQGRGENCAKCIIDPAVAHELIHKLDLQEVQSSVFKSGKSYHTKEYCRKTVEKLMKSVQEKEIELDILKRMRDSYFPTFDLQK